MLNLLKIPNFGRGAEVNVMVQVLLSYVHGGYLWLGKRVGLKIYLIHCITRLSKSGKDPQTHISGKNKDTKLPMLLVNKYKL